MEGGTRKYQVENYIILNFVLFSQQHGNYTIAI